MSPRWADRLSAVRQRLFVGRDAERALFQAILDAPELPVQVLYVFGPGGIGKTTLLEQFAVLCAHADTGVSRLDARTIEPSPEAFLAALHRALGGTPVDAQMPSFDDVSRHVLLIDTYELLTPLDGWLRETFLPQLPTHVLVVLAGRQPPAPAWRADPGWQT